MNVLSLASIAACQYFLPQMTKRIPENADEPDCSAIMDVEASVADFNKIAETNVAISFHGMLELIQRIGCIERDFAVDLACGPGHFTLMLAKELGFKKVIGIDLSPRMLQQAKHNADVAGLADRVSFICADVTNFADTLTDLQKPNLVTCTNSAHHLPTLEHVRMMARQMEYAVGPSGHAVIMDLVRLKTDWAIKRYVECFGSEYLDAGLISLHEDFSNSMRAAWSNAELASIACGYWSHYCLAPVPINQFLVLKPNSQDVFFGELANNVPERFRNEFGLYSRLLLSTLRTQT